MPREILSDQGSDIHKGIRQFCQAPPETSFIYDIKHKGAAVLKRELGADPTWPEFSRWAGQTSQRVQQTALAALAPPRQRRKARYMNVAELVGWGVRMLKYGEEEGSQRQAGDQQRVEQTVGWGREYRQEGEQWRQWVEVGTITEQFVKAHGVSAGGAQQWQHRLAAAGSLPRTQQLCAEFVQCVAAEGANANVGERLVGSSEVIESIFGKWKRLEGEQARSGLTGVVLALGALVAPTTAQVIKQALTTVPTKTVLTWCREKLGKTVHATRPRSLPRCTQRNENRISSRSLLETIFVTPGWDCTRRVLAGLVLIRTTAGRGGGCPAVCAPPRGTRIRWWRCFWMSGALNAGRRSHRRGEWKPRWPHGRATLNTGGQLGRSMPGLDKGTLSLVTSWDDNTGDRSLPASIAHIPRGTSFMGSKTTGAFTRLRTC